MVALEQLPNTIQPISETDFGMITEVKPLHQAKAESSMKVTLFGIVTEVKPLHSEKALSPMDSTLFGIVTEVKPLCPEKALSPMEVTLFGIRLVCIPTTKRLVSRSITQLSWL